MGQRIFGYARVSSKEQNLDRQIVRLKQHVSAENILTDKASGKDLERPAYQALKGTLGLRVGDISHLYAGKEKVSFSARFCETYGNEEQRH